jgi:deoxyadenosine/deoxycytidine kinase
VNQANWTQWIGIVLTILAILLIPAIGLLVRLVVKWTKVEDRLESLARSMEVLVQDKEKTHSEMLAQMREDRTATNTRLRWLEEHVWRGEGRGRHAIRDTEGG